MRIGKKKLIQLIETETGQDNTIVFIHEKDGTEFVLNEREFQKALAFMESIEPFMRPI